MTVLESEPQIDIEDVQGHIHPGFGAQHSVVLGFRLSDDAAAAGALAALVPAVTPMAEALDARAARRVAHLQRTPPPSQSDAMLGLSLSAAAIDALGVSVSSFGFSFTDGMANDAGALGDPLDGDLRPRHWTAGATAATAIDLFLVAGGSSPTRLAQRVDEWISSASGGFELVLRESGRRRPGDKEFFGFADGISNPALRGKDADGRPIDRRTIDPADERAALFSRPGHRLIWPGNFLFGLPSESSDPLVAGPRVPAPHPIMVNGSFLVFRRLAQDVAAFQAAVDAASSKLAADGIAIPPDRLQAMLVGRWPDGTPLHLSPDGPDESISGDRDRVNNFGYERGTEAIGVETPNGMRALPAAPGDPIGRIVPLMAHIRQVNPRDGLSEIGAENHPDRQVLRRGVTYGPEMEDDPDAERGLLFLCYQTSITRQFRFLQQNWANSPARPVGKGVDPLIGQDGEDQPNRELAVPVPGNSEQRCPFNGRWVTATAGAYLATPSLSGLRRLAGLG